MARPLRLEYPGALYHITSRGNERKKIYRNSRDYDLFLDTLAKVIEEMGWLCHTYCFMPNHYHLLIETREPNLSKGMRQLNGIYTQAFNYRHKRCGHLFQGRYKAIVVQKESHLLELCRYVVLNPVRAAMVEKAEDWAYSSYRSTAGFTRSTPFLHTDWVLTQFGKKKKRAQAAYRHFVAEGSEMPSPWSALVGQVYLGSQEFREDLRRILNDTPLASEIPRVQTRPAPPSVGEILENVARYYGIGVEEIVAPRSRSEARDVAIFLSRKLCGLDLKTIAAHFGIGYTRVSQVTGKVTKVLESNKRIRKLVKSIEDEQTAN